MLKTRPVQTLEGDNWWSLCVQHIPSHIPMTTAAVYKAVVHTGNMQRNIQVRPVDIPLLRDCLHYTSTLRYACLLQLKSINNYYYRASYRFIRIFLDFLCISIGEWCYGGWDGVWNNFCDRK